MPRDPTQRRLDDRIRGEHMLKAARDVVLMATNRVRGDLDTDMILRRAMVNAIQDIGEAANQITEVGKARMSAVPWKQLVGMRHRLVHGYDAINLDTVWQVATHEVQPLIAALECAFASWPLPDPPLD
ncbi:MAG: DUF86 domain-containing protein [Planctomycetaceae bacterium]|jgi:uncharacterized protein with HEPN domain|nr:DUF86 domain-containing protein [Phycisphaerales bacterium]MCE2654293.1 DUF86 domain-containing protein [Planctomycetaceae bacterium]